MATTLDTETNLNVTISEEVIQNGVKQNNINTVTIPVKKVYRRVRTITNNKLPWQVLINADPSGGTGNESFINNTQRSIRYFRVTNLDDTYSVDITVRSDAGLTTPNEFVYRIPAGQSFLLPAHATTGWITTMNAKDDEDPDAPIGLYSIEFQTPDTGAKVDIEIFEGSVDFV